MNNLYIHVSDALTVAATCDGYLLAYKTLDYSNVALEEIYTTFSCIEFNNAFVVFDGRPSIEQYKGTVQAFCLEVDGKKIYGNVNADDVTILYRLLKGMGIQNVQMFDYSVAMLLTIGKSVCLYRSYEKYLVFPGEMKLFHYVEAGDEVFQYAKKNGLLIFEEVGAATADLFKENFLTEKQRRKLACFGIALAYCQPYQIKPNAGETTVQGLEQLTVPDVEIEQSRDEEVTVQELLQNVAAEVEQESEQEQASTSKLVVSRPARFKKISADKVDLLNLPEYCKIEIDFDLVHRQIQQRKEGREVEKSVPIVVVDLDKYDKILRTEGDVLNLYPVPGSAFSNLEKEEEPKLKSDTGTEQPVKPEGTTTPVGGQFNPISLLDTSFLSGDNTQTDEISQVGLEEDEDSQMENALAEQSAEGFLVEKFIPDTEVVKSLQTEGDILADDGQSIEKPKLSANADFSSFMQTIHSGASNNRFAPNSRGVTAEVIAQTERNARLESLNYATTGQVNGQQDLQLFADTAAMLNDEEFDPAQAAEFNIHVAMTRRRKGSSVGFAVLGVIDVLLIALLVLSFFSGKFIRTAYTDEEKQILNTCRTMAEFRGYVDALLAGGDSEIIAEMENVGKITQIIRADVYTNGMHESSYVVRIPEWTTPEKVILELQSDYPGAEISGMSDQRLCSIIISSQKGVDQ